MRWRCYCCGEELDDTFALVTMGDQTRAFTMKPEHAKRADAAHIETVTKGDEVPRDAARYREVRTWHIAELTFNSNGEPSCEELKIQPRMTANLRMQSHFDAFVDISIINKRG